MDLKELLIQLQNDKMEYFDEFYNLTKNKVFYMAYSILQDYHLSEDILQDTYIKFLKHKKKVKVDGNILSYLLEISKNLSLNYVNKHKKVVNIDNIVFKYEEQYQEKFEELKLVKDMKKILNENEFQIVILKIINELTNNEIAQLLNKPLGTVLWTYNNAIKKLRRDL
ncbi:MAG: sigma-70 family RNA polymerase sigma factor [Bacilli bacterium]